MQFGGVRIPDALLEATLSGVLLSLQVLVYRRLSLLSFLYLMTW